MISLPQTSAHLEGERDERENLLEKLDPAIQVVHQSVSGVDGRIVGETKADTDTAQAGAHKPLFISLKRAYFEAFKAGTKTEEFRPEGPRWNARTCAVGRRVVLSLGYGKAHRLAGVVAGYRSSAEPTLTPAWKDCYGDRAGVAACIRIELD